MLIILLQCNILLSIRGFNWMPSDAHTHTDMKHNQWKLCVVTGTARIHCTFLGCAVATRELTCSETCLGVFYVG